MFFRAVDNFLELGNSCHGNKGLSHNIYITYLLILILLPTLVDTQYTQYMFNNMYSKLFLDFNSN